MNQGIYWVWLYCIKFLSYSLVIDHVYSENSEERTCTTIFLSLATTELQLHEKQIKSSSQKRERYIKVILTTWKVYFVTHRHVVVVIVGCVYCYSRT